MGRMILLLVVIFGCINLAFNQKYEANWVFGDSAGLNFNDGIISYFNSSILDGEAAASISDSLGNLLFYTNGQNVWNKNHEIMPNGDSLEIGLVGDFVSSETQGVLILPKPDTPNFYYIFQLQDHGPFGVKYSMVNMNLSGGLGDVSVKNITLYDLDITEKMQFVKHGNGVDYWLILHQWPDLIETDDSTYIFTSFLITPSAILGPYKQVYGPKAFLPDIPYFGWGEMIISETGNKLVYIRQDKIDIYDFDRCSGVFENWIEITNLPQLMHYGGSISPDGTKIYVSTVGDNESYIFQFSLTAENIDSTRQLVFENTFNNYAIGQHELGPDGKIYIAMYAYGEFPNEIFTSKNQNLCVINNPNELFPLCDFDTNTISLGERRVIGGLPNLPNYNLGALIGSECDTITTNIPNISNINFFKISPNPASNEIYIKSNNFESESFNISIINALGAQVIYKIGSQLNDPIDISKLQPGIYLVQLFKNDSAFAIEKLVVY